MKAPARIGLAIAVAVFGGGGARAQAREARVAVGGELRNGDWLALETVGLVLVGGSEDGANVAATARGVLAVGGAGGAIGVASGLGGPCVEPAGCRLRESLFSTIVGIEARVERTYGRSSWSHATYAGPHLSFGGIFTKWSAGWMFDLADGRNNHFQLGVGGGW